jgi:tellurium resistance protein TerD
MAINLQKGQRVSLDDSMKLALVGLGWDTNRYDGGNDFDLDASAFLLGEDGKLIKAEDFVFYNNLSARNGAVVHTGDNLTGEGEGDDEVIMIDFTKIPSEIKKIAICVTIHDAAARRQNFGQVSNAYIRIAKLADEFDDVGEPVLKFDLEEEFSIETALVVAEIYLKNGEWKFNAIAAGYQGGLEAILNSFGGDKF